MRLTIALSAAVFILLSTSSYADSRKISETGIEGVSLEKIMADPDWMGNSPQKPVWSLDEKSIYYSRKTPGHSHLQHFRISLSDNETVFLAENDELLVSSQKSIRNTAGTSGVFTFEGDVYFKNYQTGKITAITADKQIQSNARFINDEDISFMVGHKIFIRHPSGLIKQIAEFKLTADPDKKEVENYLEQSQPRIIETLRNIRTETLFQKERHKRNERNKTDTWYLGKNIKIRTFQMSPDAKWLLLGTVDKKLEGKADHMPEFVTENGYVKDRKVRALVGTAEPLSERFYLLDLTAHKKYVIDISKLPGINDDPLDKLKKDAARKIGYKYKPHEGPRAIYADSDEKPAVRWTQDSSRLALMLYSYDNKDRWIVGLNVTKKKLKTYHWLSDDAWVNDWSFTDFGWLPDHNTLYYLSEEDGYSHLYIKKNKRRARQLTKGKFEVSDLTVSRDGKYFYFKANIRHPGVYEIYRVSAQGGKPEPLTNLGGMNDYWLSPAENKVLIRHSTTITQPELYLVDVGQLKSVTRLTDTASESFKKVKWSKPQIIGVPSTHIKRPIYSRYYAARNDSKTGVNQKKPAVIFVHGAGYLQNSHAGWSNYFREFMFHSLLTSKGYVVLDMDYRASKGYGRDWRTAIYRKMGTPELEDLTDGARWLVDNANVDPERIGIYGGSYGGFMTFMALFKEPEVFAAGAALRPVTDWSHYNHGYTSNILNTPQVDPTAYELSSPIEFASGLNKPLLICHGMIDDNVFFKDSVRLVQRLIELKKTRYFETAIYPVEPHGFKQPSSWLDEYTRIYQLFEEHLN